MNDKTALIAIVAAIILPQNAGSIPRAIRAAKELIAAAEQS